MIPPGLCSCFIAQNLDYQLPQILFEHEEKLIAF
jgi:hypothetical protein